MKLLTTIAARRDGTVSVVLPVTRGQARFQPDESGALVADVADPADVAALLRLGTFEPYDERDFEVAEALLGEATRVDGGVTNDEGRDDDDDDGNEDEIVNGGLPVEANTPPKGDAPPVEGAGAAPAGDAAGAPDAAGAGAGAGAEVPARKPRAR